MRNYSQKTIKSYLGCLRDYLQNLQTFSNCFERINVDSIRKFLLKKQERGASPQTVNLYLNAIKFFYRDVIKVLQKIDLKFAKRNQRLPIVLSRQEISQIISAVQNAKHRLMLALAYGAGLRVSEVINLRVRDVDLQELTIHACKTSQRQKRSFNYIS